MLQHQSAIILYKLKYKVFQFSSVTQSCPTLCNPMDCCTPDFLVHHQLPELPQTQVHQVSDAIQPSHPLSFPLPAFNLSQHQGLFKLVLFVFQIYTQGQNCWLVSHLLKSRTDPIILLISSSQKILAEHLQVVLLKSKS